MCERRIGVGELRADPHGCPGGGPDRDDAEESRDGLAEDAQDDAGSILEGNLSMPCYATIHFAVLFSLLPW